MDDKPVFLFLNFEPRQLGPFARPLYANPRFNFVERSMPMALQSRAIEGEKIAPVEIKCHRQMTAFIEVRAVLAVFEKNEPTQGLAAKLETKGASRRLGKIFLTTAAVFIGVPRALDRETLRYSRGKKRDRARGSASKNNLHHYRNRRATYLWPHRRAWRLLLPLSKGLLDFVFTFFFLGWVGQVIKAPPQRLDVIMRALGDATNHWQGPAGLF